MTMDTIGKATVIGEIDGTPERKKVNEKDVCDFRVAGLALRISAWEDRAKAVPDRGRVVVEGDLRTRTYTVKGEDRQTTEIIARNIIVLDVPSGETDDALPF